MEELFNHYMGVKIKPCVAKTEVSRFSSCFFILLFICFLSLFRSWTSPFLGSSKASFMRVKLLQETCGLLHVLLFFSFDSFFITIDSKICRE